MTDLFDALLHAVAYALVGGAMLVVAYYVLDLATPGHLGTHLRGVDENGNESVHAHSKGAGVVTSAWLVSNAAVLFTALSKVRGTIRKRCVAKVFVARSSICNS